MNEFNETVAKINRNVEDVDRFADSYNKTNNNASPSDSIASSDPTDEVKFNIEVHLYLSTKTILVSWF